MENYTGDDTAGTDKMSVYITTDNLPATGIVSVPLGGFSQNFNIPANSTTQIIIPTAIVMCTTTDMNDNKGVHVTSDVPVTVYQLNYVQQTSDAAIIIPTISLGKRYRATTYSATDGDFELSELMVVAAYNGTVIKITPKCATLGGHAANVPFTVTLNQGEVYQIQGNYLSSTDLTGSLIELDTTAADNCKTFAVFSGNKCAYVPLGFTACNHLCEQMMPMNTWGKEYITVPLKTRTGGDLFRIMASQNGTIFTINGGVPNGLNAGGFYDVTLATASYINSNKPISVAQFSRGWQTDGNVNSDPFMIMVNPLVQTIDYIVFNSFTTPIITAYNCNIVTKTANTGLVTLDGNPVTFSPVFSFPQYSYAQVAVTQGNHLLRSDSGLVANVYGYGPWEAYGYIAGATVKNLDIDFSVITPTDTVKYYHFTDTICKGTPLIFSASFNQSISDYYWDFGDGTAQVHGQQVAHTFVNAGDFNVTYYYQRNNICGLDSVLWQIHIKCCNPLPGIDAINPACVGIPAAITDTSTFNPNAVYTWDFAGGNIISGNGQGPYQVSWNNTGTDTLWVFVAEPNCQIDSAGFIMDVYPVPASTFDVITPICLNEFSTITYTGSASPAATYNWDFLGGNVLSGSGQGPYNVNWTTSGTYNLDLTVIENGCTSLPSSNPVTVLQSPVASFMPDQQTVFVEDPIVNFTDGSAGAITWSWDFGDTLSGSDNFSDLPSPEHIFSHQGEYEVWLTVTNSEGCVDSTSMMIRVVDIHVYYMPNSFSPNADGINDIFQPYSTDIDYLLYIYNRWGELLFASPLENVGWDGKYNGLPVIPDVYTWAMIFSFKGSAPKMVYGRVTVLKK